MATRNKEVGRRYYAPVSLERQARLEKTFKREKMKAWAQETGLEERLLNLVIGHVRQQEGLSADPSTWRIIPDESGYSA